MVSECRCHRCRRWRGDGDGDGVGMLTALLLPLLRQCCCSQAVSRQTGLQMVPAPTNPNQIPPGHGSLRLPGRSSRTGQARLALTRCCCCCRRSSDGDGIGVGMPPPPPPHQAESFHTLSDTACALSSAVASFSPSSQSPSLVPGQDDDGSFGEDT